MNKELDAWEGEGGAAVVSPLPGLVQMTGTAAQVEWAERIRQQVNSEFDRVASSFRAVAEKQHDGKRADTETILAILEDKRAEVMSREQAGYFIRDWQEMDDQVRQLIAKDSRYQEIKARSKVN